MSTQMPPGYPPLPAGLDLTIDGDRRKERISGVALLFNELTFACSALLPDSYDKSMAMARLREAYLWAWASLATVPTQVVAGEAAGDSEIEL